jgi:predicted NBD/HSP70 family sugar kinase
LIGETVLELQKEVNEVSYDTLVHFINETVTMDEHIHILALGLPGVIQNGYISSCDITSLNGLDLGTTLSEDLQLPILIENDVNSTVLGFYQKVQINKDESTVYIYYPHADKLGSGIIINGHILYGKSNYAGEAGLLPLDDYLGDSSMVDKDVTSFATQVAKMIMTFICIINPENMVLSGYGINESTVTMIHNQLDKLCSNAHQPTIFWEHDIKENYLWGLHSLALERLTYNIVVNTKY